MTRAVQKWRRFFQLSGYERRAVIEAAAVLVITRAGLKVAGFRGWKRALELLVRRTPVQPFVSDAIELARSVARLESAAARNLFFPANCLENSLVLWFLLRGRGIPAELRIGGRKNSQKFEAHAWVECSGIILNEPEATHRHFAPFDGPIVSANPEMH